mmetsp:Transcript_10557/g.29123  ORF Transcript_10557/g.29123 Transcript_10557/m.29123 type:complete len:142 (+) Transcript_10557:73-498(+)
MAVCNTGSVALADRAADLRSNAVEYYTTAASCFSPTCWIEDTESEEAVFALGDDDDDDEPTTSLSINPKYGLQDEWTLRGNIFPATAASSNCDGVLGGRCSFMPTLGRLETGMEPLRQLHCRQQVTAFSHSSLPPMHRGWT